MAKSVKKAGKGRVVTNAPKSAKGKSTKTVAMAIAKANAVNASRRVKQFATTDGVVELLDSLTKKMPVAILNDTAERRREWCIANGVNAVAVYDDGLCERRNSEMPESKDKWRPEATIRQRLASIAGVNGEHFHYTRAESSPDQFKKVISLDWSKGIPENFGGADLVFIYRVK